MFLSFIFTKTSLSYYFSPRSRGLLSPFTQNNETFHLLLIIYLQDTCLLVAYHLFDFPTSEGEMLSNSFLLYYATNSFQHQTLKTIEYSICLIKYVSTFYQVVFVIRLSRFTLQLSRSCTSIKHILHVYQAVLDGVLSRF